MSIHPFDLPSDPVSLISSHTDLSTRHTTYLVLFLSFVSVVDPKILEISQLHSLSQ